MELFCAPAHIFPVWFLLFIPHLISANLLLPLCITFFVRWSDFPTFVPPLNERVSELKVAKVLQVTNRFKFENTFLCSRCFVSAAEWKFVLCKALLTAVVNLCKSAWNPCQWGKTLVLVGRWVGRENVCTNMENQFSSWG